jgi:hypothetical protein
VDAKGAKRGRSPRPCASFIGGENPGVAVTTAGTRGDGQDGGSRCLKADAWSKCHGSKTTADRWGPLGLIFNQNFQNSSDL